MLIYNPCCKILEYDYGTGWTSFQVINKTDLAQAIGADLGVMQRDALRMRDGGPFVFAQVSKVHYLLE